MPKWDNGPGQHDLRADVHRGRAATSTACYAANDTLANAAIPILKRNSRGKVPVTGQDATVEGLQNILAGDQCMTV